MPPDRLSPMPAEDLLSSSPFATASQTTSTSNPFSTSASPVPSSRLGTSPFPFRKQADTVVEKSGVEDEVSSLTVETGRNVRGGGRGTTEGRGGAMGRGTFSGASSLDSAPTPTAYESRSLLGILNPRSGPTTRPTPHSGDRETNPLSGSSNARRQAPSDATDEGDEEDEGPPDSLMIEMASPNSDALPLETRPSIRPPQNGHLPGREGIESRSRSPSPSLTRHAQTLAEHSRTNGTSWALSGAPGKAKIRRSPGRSPSRPSNDNEEAEDDDDDLREFYPSPGARSPHAHPATNNDYPAAETDGGPAVDASTAFLSGAQRTGRPFRGRRTPTSPRSVSRAEEGRRAESAEREEGYGLLEKMRRAWGQERDVWLPSAERRGPVHLQTDDQPSARQSKQSRFGTSRERAKYRLANLPTLTSDSFLSSVYSYYAQHGLSVIALSKLLSLLTVGFVVYFSMFFLWCVDYSALRGSTSLGQVVIPHCVGRFSGLTLLIAIGTGIVYGSRIVSFGIDVRRLQKMRSFYRELLEVGEEDLQTVPWHAVVDRLAALQADHPSRLAGPPLSAVTSPNPQLSSAASSGTTAGQPHPPRGAPRHPHSRLDAHEVANRIMRQENYFIALFNNPSVLNLETPLWPRLLCWVRRRLGMPPGVKGGGQEKGGGGYLSRALEWNLRWVVREMLLDENGQVRSEVLLSSEREQLVARMEARFRAMALCNVLAAVPLLVYHLAYNFLKYFEEYHKNPSSIGSRSYTLLAKWKFREFNELPHHFRDRLDRSYDFAKEYVDRFPKEKTALVARFVAFVAGSFAAVLIILSIFDPDAFLHFEITPERSVLFYIGLFGGILALARGMIPEDHSFIDPADLMQAIALHTHYLPDEWKGKLHSAEVHQDFSALFQMKVVIFAQELLSVFVTPALLWFVFPKRSAAIVDFFRVHTKHQEGLGFICSFAAFEFPAPPDPQTHAARPKASPDPGEAIVQDKMGKSILNFQAHHPTWEPSNQTASLYLSQMTDAHSFAPTRAGAGLRAGQHGLGVGKGGSILLRSRWGAPGPHSRGLQGHQSGMGSTAAFSRSPFGLAATQVMPAMHRSAYVNNIGAASALAPPIARIGRSAMGFRHFGRPDLGVEDIDEEENVEEEPPTSAKMDPAGSPTKAWSASSESASPNRRMSAVEAREGDQDPFRG